MEKPKYLTTDDWHNYTGNFYDLWYAERQILCWDYAEKGDPPRANHWTLICRNIPEEELDYFTEEYISSRLNNKGGSHPHLEVSGIRMLWNDYVNDFNGLDRGFKEKKHNSDFVLYRFFESQILLYVGQSIRCYDRLKQHQNREFYKRSTHITLERFGSKKELNHREILAITSEHPEYNVMYKIK
jgi:hypothetical protein